MRDETTHESGHLRRLARLVFAIGPGRDRTAATSDGWLTLACGGGRVQAIDARDDPVTGRIVAEDTCWLFAVQDWRCRQPRRWRRQARRAWRAEARMLADKRTRLVAAAEGLSARRPPDRSFHAPKLPG